ncbi:MAG TPA: hypothetical protein VM366_18660, partial [Anaerolineae bacterium]|nr:hypothetical protein [Anaerolineae bacterium]
MAWSELTDLRNRRSRTYEQGKQRRWSGTLATLHYESALDSGQHDAEIDTAPVRTINAQFDGWRVTANGWHYALGKDIANHGDEDGWLGFGGRQGAHWFKFRLLRVGYLHWPTRAWQDVGGVPTYKRSDLSSETRTLAVGPNDDQINVESVATWANIWKTPIGGALDVSWKVRGDQLKEEIVVNQAAREWIAANRPPTTPLAETWFGFVFRLDWSDIPKVVRASVQQDADSDFADDDEPIELRDALDRLLAYMPLDEVRTRAPVKEDLIGSAPLRKRFYKDGADHYLLVGVRCDQLVALPAGDLVFDPTVNEQVPATECDGHEDTGTTWHPNGFDYDGWRLGKSDSAADWFDAGLVFTTVAVPNGATINSASIQIWTHWIKYVGLNLDVTYKGFDVDSSPVFAGDGSDRPSTRAKTTATVNETLTPVDERWETTDDISTIVKELVDRDGWASGNNMGFVIGNNDAADADYGQWNDF